MEDLEPRCKKTVLCLCETVKLALTYKAAKCLVWRSHEKKKKKKLSRGDDITIVASIKSSLQKHTVTCCRTSLNKSQQATSSFLINRSCLCLMLVALLFIAFQQNGRSRAANNVTRSYMYAGKHTDTTVGRQFTTYLNLTGCITIHWTQISIFKQQLSAHIELFNGICATQLTIRS